MPAQSKQARILTQIAAEAQQKVCYDAARSHASVLTEPESAEFRAVQP